MSTLAGDLLGGVDQDLERLALPSSAGPGRLLLVTHARQRTQR